MIREDIPRAIAARGQRALRGVIGENRNLPRLEMVKQKCIKNGQIRMHHFCVTRDEGRVAQDLMLSNSTPDTCHSISRKDDTYLLDHK